MHWVTPTRGGTLRHHATYSCMYRGLGFVVVEDPFVEEMSEAEATCGFTVREHPTGKRLVVRELGGGLRAVKVRLGKNQTGYAICEDDLRPIYPAASTLAELKARFASKR